MSDLTAVLNKLADGNSPLKHRELRGLSDVGSESEAELLAAWQPIRVERRRALVKAMTSLAEDNIEFDFRDVLSAVLADPDPVVRQSAADGLWEDERLRTMRRLLRLLNDDPDSDVRAAAALSLGHFAEKATLGELRADDGQDLRTALMRAASAANTDVDSRRRALETLGYFNGADVTAVIAEAYAGGQQPLKESALVAIGYNLDLRWLPVLQAELASSIPALQYEAARAAGHFAGEAKGLLSALLPLTEEGDIEVAGAAVWAMGQIGGDAARRVLRRLTRSDDPAIQQAAEEALDELRFNEEGRFI